MHNVVKMVLQLMYTLQKKYCIISVPEPLHTNGIEIHTSNILALIIAHEMVYYHTDGLSEVVVQIAIHTSTSNTQ